MIVFIPKEKSRNETRVSATPDTVKDLIKAGLEVHIESNAGLESFISNEEEFLPLVIPPNFIL